MTDKGQKAIKLARQAAKEKFLELIKDPKHYPGRDETMNQVWAAGITAYLYHMVDLNASKQ